MFFLATRQLLSSKKQSALTLLSITLGAAAYVVISGMMIGFQEFIISQLISNDAHVRISSRTELIGERSLNDVFFPKAALIKWGIPPSGRRENESIENPRGWFDLLSQNTDVLAFAPQLKTQVLARRGKTSVSASLIGTDVEQQVHVTKIEENMVKGQFIDIAAGGNRVVVGDGLLSRLGARYSETILLTSAFGEPVPVKVAGVFHIGIKTIDDSAIFGHLGDVQNINHTPSRVSDIAIKLTDPSIAAVQASQWQSLSLDLVQSWDQANEGILSVFKTQDFVRNAMTFSILIVAGFGIYNILSMAVSQRQKEIAILRSMGYESHDIVSLFLSQGVILGTMGGLLGMVIGNLICHYISTIPISKERGFGGDTIMMSYSTLIYVKAFLLAFCSSSLAGWLPARAAGKLSPMDIIRFGGAS